MVTFGPSINKSYSLLQEMCINCFKSEYCASNLNIVLYPDLLAVGGGTHDMCATEIKIATFLIRPNSLLEEVCMHSFKSSNIVGHFQRWAANSYPPI